MVRLSPAAVEIVELALGHGIVDVDGGNFEISEFVHLQKPNMQIVFKNRIQTRWIYEIHTEIMITDERQDQIRHVWVQWSPNR